MSDNSQSTLLRLSQTIASLTAQVHEHLHKASQQEPDFTPNSSEIVTEGIKFETIKIALSEAARDLQLLVNGPTLRAFYGTHYDLAAHQAALKFDFFGKDSPRWDRDTLERILRLLVTPRIFHESSGNEFSHTSFHMQMDEVFQSASETAIFLRQSTSPLAATNCPFHQRFKVPIFEYYQQNPTKVARFGKALAGATKLDRNVSALRDVYDWGSIGKGLIVDVGGVDGSVSLLLAKEWPELSFVVQDSSPTLLSQGSLRLPPQYTSRFSFQEYDFFTPQLITQADLFFIRQCLHNWPDAACIKILRGFVLALENCKDGTPILINESILPRPGSGVISRSEERLMRQVDLSMLINVGARQRTEDDFHRLVKAADNRLDIVKVHSVGSMGLLEVHLFK
ncbi:S-adenosyl-L-methionine-dependent methyltransferase [Lentithecium fluviatile CBS 122367]|uniref:S-adenosyl-L-methionine-dependent methyltransferase n=1 Tax=Lentithecium fluviatile CBS 122367 TaxID=1168545 RepID=A0A6G1ISX8_9PLEO|nr:S-adenosyl-L-methionine-dependent methyltransferase [Lentithecium fluviatile CBS 122367]